jgi:hypothetical protein
MRGSIDVRTEGRRFAPLAPHFTGLGDGRSRVFCRQVSSAWPAEHRKDGGRRANLDGAEELEPVPFVEGDILRVAGFEVGTGMVAITGHKGVLQ